MQKKQKTTTLGKFQVHSLFNQCFNIVSRLPKSELREIAKIYPMLPDRINALLIFKFKFFTCRGRLEGLTPEPCGRCPEANFVCSESLDECCNPIMKYTTNLGGLIDNCSLSHDKEGKLINVSIEHAAVYMCKMEFSIKIDPSMEDLGLGPECIKKAKGLFISFFKKLQFVVPYNGRRYHIPEPTWIDIDVNISFKGDDEWIIRIHCPERLAIWCEFVIHVENLKTFINLSQ